MTNNTKYNAGDLFIHIEPSFMLFQLVCYVDNICVNTIGYDHNRCDTAEFVNRCRLSDYVLKNYYKLLSTCDE